MSIFTSKKVEWRRQVAKHNVTKTSYEELERLMGSKLTKEFVELIYTKAKEQTNEGILDLTPRQPLGVVQVIIQNERTSILRRRGFYQGYMQEARSGQLGRDLDNNLEPMNNIYANPLRNGLAGRDLAIDQAANWICGTYTAALPGTRALLEEYIPNNQSTRGKFGACLGQTPAQLWKVHARLVPGLPSQTRLSTKMTPKYPSTVGAGYLFDELYTVVQGQQVWPPFGDAHWASIATFYLASIGTIQVFPDGNKRMSRFAYSVILINGTHTFKAPTDAHAMGLYRMQG